MDAQVPQETGCRERPYCMLAMHGAIAGIACEFLKIK